MPELTLDADERAPREARNFLRSLMASAPEEMRARACQVVTELVTNSVRHAAGPTLTLGAEFDGHGQLDLEVRDLGSGFDVQPRAPGHAEAGGWGLVFVDMLAESWASGGPGAPVVWAHLEPRDLDGEQAAIDPDLDGRLRDLLDVRMLVESIKDYAIFALDREGRITLWNAGGERLTGYATDEILGQSIAALHRDPAVVGELAGALAAGRHEYERWLYRKDGSRVWTDSVVTPILDSSSSLRGFSVVTRDVTWRKHLDESREDLIARIRHLARSDDLTGLPNRRRWQEELDREMARARRTGAPLCVAMVDLDGFKNYNDANGHLAGDDLLVLTGHAWAEAVRATDMLARYGGDEFSVILPDCPPGEALTVLDRMRIATPPPLTCSAGIACTLGSEPAETVVRRADTALYDAKRRGRNTTSTAA